MQFANTLAPSFVRFSDVLKFTNLTHEENAPLPICVTVSGSCKLLNRLSPPKALSFIYLSPPSTMTDFNDLQSKKAVAPIVTILSGIVTFVMLEY